MTTDYQLENKIFEFSLKLMDLYVSLLKEGDFDLSSKILKSGLRLSDGVNEYNGADTFQEAIQALRQLNEYAIQTRYWIKEVQMKNAKSEACDEGVEALNEIINIIHYLSRHESANRFNYHYQLN